MSKMILAIAVVLCLAAAAQADLYTFDFEGVETSSDSSIGNYMTNVYDHRTITVDNATVIDNSSNYGDDWNGKSGGDNYFYVDSSSGHADVFFTGAPIYNISGDGYVFDATPGADWVLNGYDSGNNLVNSFIMDFGESTYTTEEWSWAHWGWETVVHTIDLGDDSAFTFDLAFATAVTRIRLSDDGRYDVGMDNVVVDDAPISTPIPGAVLLGMLGLSVAGVKLRKQA